MIKAGKICVVVAISPFLFSNNKRKELILFWGRNPQALKSFQVNHWLQEHIVFDVTTEYMAYKHPNFGLLEKYVRN